MKLVARQIKTLFRSTAGHLAIISLFGFSPYALSSPQPDGSAGARAGYLDLNDPSIPALVQSREGSIFRIVELAHPAFSERLSRGEREAFLTSRCSRPEHFLLSLQCKALRGDPNLGEEWFLPFLSAGTAFFAENSHTLWTAWHNLSGQNESFLLFVSQGLKTWPMKKRQALLRNLVPAFLLFNSSGEMVFDSRSAVTKPEYLSNGDPVVRQAYSHDKILTTALDFARIRMPPQFRRPPIPIAEKTSAGEPVFLLGFPGPSETASPGRIKSNGFNFCVSSGRRIPIERLLLRLGLPEVESSSVITHKLLRTVHGLDLDLQTGFSGGPILNPEGELLGILSSRLGDPGAPAAGAFAVNASWVTEFSRDAEAALRRWAN